MRYRAYRIAIYYTLIFLTVWFSLACGAVGNVSQEAPPPNAVIVAQKGGGQYKSIGEALRAVQPGMRILVRPGLYRENLIIDKPVEIVADTRGESESVSIQTLNSSSITMRTERALVRGFIIRHRVGFMGELFNLLSKNKTPAVDVPQGELVLEHCDIVSNSVAGIAIHGTTANPVIRNTKIHDGKSNGVWVYDGAQGTLEDCDISGTYWSAVRIEEGGNPILRRCKVSKSKQAGIVVTDGGMGRIEDCEIFDNYLGLESRRGSKPTVLRTNIHQSRHNGVYVQESSSALIEECQIYSNGNVGLQITEHSTPVVARSRIFDNVYSDVEILEGSDPIIRDCTIYGGEMSGLFVYNGGQGTIENCDIFGHTNHQEVAIKGGNPLLRNCKIHKGKMGGVLFLENAAGTLEDCDIRENGHSGVWIRTGSQPTIRNTKINNNDGVAVFAEQNTAGTVMDCNLTGNKAGTWNVQAGSLLKRSGNIE